MPRLLLTIDDSPSGTTDDLTDFLSARGVPAILFCRGDRLEKNPDPIVRAIQKGFTIGNHAWSHTRFSTLSFEQGVTEIDQTQALIDATYDRAGVARSPRYFRFPHMDRGCGGWIVDYDAAGPHRDFLIRFFGDGLNISLDPPSDALKKKQQRWQDHLAQSGFLPLPASGITLPWFTGSGMAQAIDAMYTYSTSDWMVTARHAGKWPYQDVNDLLRKIDDDPGLQTTDTDHIILAHDQDELLPVVRSLVDHMIAKGFIFRGV